MFETTTPKTPLGIKIAVAAAILIPAGGLFGRWMGWW